MKHREEEEKPLKENGNSRYGSGIDGLCTVLIDTITLFEKVQRKFHPVMMKKHGELLARKAADLQRAVDDFISGMPAPGAGTEAEAILKASGLVMEAVSRFKGSDDLEAGIFLAMQAGRKMCRAYEALFPLCSELPMIEGLFSEKTPGDVRQRGESAPEEIDRIVHLGPGGEGYARGTASLYMPGSISMEPMPLVIALHGGYGHGRDFLWTWIREARSRRFVVLAPTSVGMTWSIADMKADLIPLTDLVRRITEGYPVDRGKILLTGISDGATFALGCAMLPDSPFSAFNPVCGVLPPGEVSQARSRRILWIHGAHDWMFPPARAGMGCTALLEAGADVELKVIPDLAHAWPREENGAILSWFDPGLAFRET